MAIGNQIRMYREQLGWRLEQLSDASGVDIGTISALENRDSDRSKYFPHLARAFGLTVEQLADASKKYALSPQGSKACVVAMEPVPEWPFQSVSPSAWDSIPEQTRALLEQQIGALIPKEADERKSPPLAA